MVSSSSSQHLLVACLARERAVSRSMLVPARSSRRGAAGSEWRRRCGPVWLWVGEMNSTGQERLV